MLTRHSGVPMSDGVHAVSGSGGAGDAPPSTINWTKYPRVADDAYARRWLTLVELRGRDPKTVDAYARALDAFLAFLSRESLGPLVVTEDHVARYLRHMRTLPGPSGSSVLHMESGAGLMNATMQLRLTVVRLFYDYLLRKHLVTEQPAPRGTFSRTGHGAAGMLRREKKLPWIPTTDQWRTILLEARDAPLRDRVMLSLSYEGALAREEVVLLEITDIDPAQRLIKVRGETAKRHRERIVSYSLTTARLLGLYFHWLREMTRARPDRWDPNERRLFRSLSHRNEGRPVTLSTWNKVVTRIATRAGVPRFSTHTFRHLYLTELARAGWDLLEIAKYAGHRNPQTTLIYIHLSGRDLQTKIARTMARVEVELQMLADTMSSASLA
ncbi:MAG TPA: site-specific integrase [Gemmatimonadaceae bacterium]|nr:site-specific integrase [Gemmatimonadaceae bacterium]